MFWHHPAPYEMQSSSFDTIVGKGSPRQDKVKPFAPPASIDVPRRSSSAGPASEQGLCGSALGTIRAMHDLMNVQDSADNLGDRVDMAAFRIDSQPPLPPRFTEVL